MNLSIFFSIICISWTPKDTIPIQHTACNFEDPYLEVQNTPRVARIIPSPPPKPFQVIEIWDNKPFDNSIETPTVLVHFVLNELEDTLYKIVEEMPRLEECDYLSTRKEIDSCTNSKLLDYIYQNMKRPILQSDLVLEGTVVVQFIINQYGDMSDVNLMRDFGGGYGKKAQRLLNTINKKWIPGKQRGRPVKVLYTLPVKFKLE